MKNLNICGRSILCFYYKQVYSTLSVWLGNILQSILFENSCFGERNVEILQNFAKQKDATSRQSDGRGGGEGEGEGEGEE